MTLLRQVVTRLREERGTALVMAILVSMVLAIAGTSLILYSTSNETSAQRSKASHDAYQLAVSGIENAVSQLGNATATQRDDPTYFSSASMCGTASNCTQAFDTGESVVWDAVLMDCNPNPCTPYTGTPVDNYIPGLRWHVTSTSTVPNPNAPGTITRTVTADVRLRPLTTQTRDESSWEYVYSWKVGDPDGCDMDLPNNPGVQSSFYVAGNLCLDNNSDVRGPQSGSDPPVKVNVRGNVYLKGINNWLGTNARPLTSLYVEGALGCKWKSQSYHYWCTDGPPEDDQVRPDSQRGSTAIPVPTARWDDWYKLASPGPKEPCDPALSSGAYPAFADDGTPHNRDLGTLGLDDSPAFSCKTLMGELTWNPSTNTLDIEGTVYWDGNLELDQVDITYDGLAAFYVSGWFRMDQAKLCAAYSAGDCSFSSWNTSQDMLFILTKSETDWSQCTDCGDLLQNSSQFQGALYAEYSMGFQNNSFVQGPMVAKEELIQNSFTFNYIPVPSNVPFGTPSNTISGWGMLPPTNFSG